ncbi:alpha/beta hydrolase family esterase [candidate division KSB1 bacterium]
MNFACTTITPPERTSSPPQQNQDPNIITINSGGIQRQFTLYIPPSLDIASESYPAVIAFHGAGGTGDGFQNYYRFDSIADSLGYIIAYPSSFENVWIEEIADSLSGYEANDLLFTSDLIDYLKDSLNVREDGIFTVGYSSGGIFVHSLANKLSGRIAAYSAYGAAMSSLIYYNIKTPNNTPVIMFHGTDDSALPWEGTERIDEFYYMSQDENLEKTLFHNGCSKSDSTITYLPDIANDGITVRKEEYRNSAKEVLVEFYAIIGGFHSWYYGDIIPEEEIMAFFNRILNKS